MDRTRAIEILRALLDDGRRWLQPEVIAALETVTDEPTIPTTTTTRGTATGFVGVFYCPSGVWLSPDRTRWLPIEPRQPAVAWNRFLSFGGPGLVRPQRADETWLQSFVDTILPSRWRVQPIEDDDTITIRLSEGTALRLPARPEMVRPIALGGTRHWDFKRGASVYDFMTLLAQAAIAQGVAPDWELQLAGGETANISVQRQRAAFPTEPVRIHSAEAYVDWADSLARAYYQMIGREVWHSTPFTAFSMLDPSEQEAWTFWMRNHPGMLRLELALRGFFDRGGAEAWIALSVERESLPHERRDWLRATRHSTGLDQLAAPGLDQGWQQILADHAQQQKLRAIPEPPRPPAGTTEADKSGYAGHLTAMPAPAADPHPWLTVENPLAMGSHDAVRLAPPAGHLAATQDTPP